MSSLLSLDQVSCQLQGRQVLRQLTLELAPGQRVALLGPNGAGKTSLLRALSGRLKLSAGQVLIGGDPAGSAGARRRVGVIPQRLSLFPRLSARENLRAFARLQGLSRVDSQRRADQSLDWVMLKSRGDEPVASLSGGMQRRVSIACGAVHEPQLLLADEPTVGVDAAQRLPVDELLNGLRDRGTTVLESTHDLTHLDARFDRVVVMNEGQIVMGGSYQELVARYLTGDRQLAHRCKITLAAVPATTPALGSGFQLDGRVISGPLVKVGKELESILRVLRQARLKVAQLSIEPPAMQDFITAATGAAR